MIHELHTFTHSYQRQHAAINFLQLFTYDTLFESRHFGSGSDFYRVLKLAQSSCFGDHVSTHYFVTTVIRRH